MYRRILLPTDGSPEADRAADHALDIAERFGAALHVLYVVDTNALPLDPHARRVFEYVEEEGRLAEEAIVGRAEDRGVDAVASEVGEGSPHEGILEYVEDNDIDLVVMGTRGRRGLERYLLGGVTERVIRLSDVPVLAVRAGGSPETGRAARNADPGSAG
jgi:nucleotide-binding universal stress UspA family protein